MKWDLSDVQAVPEWHAAWFDTWVLPVMLSAQEVAEVVQDVAVRVWVHGPEEGGDPNIPAEWHWKRELKVVKEHAKPRTIRRERVFTDDTWEMLSERQENHVVDAEYGVLDDLLLDAPPNQRGFLYHWAVEGFTVAEAAQRSGISRATGFRWRDELMTVLREKWSE